MKIRNFLPMLGCALLAACATQRPAPALAPAPVQPAPRPAPAPAPPPPQQLEWQDLPLTPGDWIYEEQAGSPQARFGSGGASFILRCNRQARQVHLLRPGVTTGNTMVVHTSETIRSLPISISRDGAATPYSAVGAEDALLDAIALSRGRFSIEVPGLPMLVIPSWAEPTRLIEECRS